MIETAAAESTPYQIRCSEIWGGTSVKSDQVVTPGVRAAIFSSASGDNDGGDIYYFSVCSYDTLTRIAVADVRGHGQAVSHLSKWLYDSLEARMNDPDGSAVLTDLNDIVRKRGFDAITTAAVATFHRDKQLLYYSYAGHPPLMLGRAGHVWRTLDVGASEGPSNLPLGVLAGVRFTQESIRIEPGDRLLAYTDGLTECPGSGEDMLYGDEQIFAALNRSALQPLPEARETLREDLTRYAAGTLVHDDVTFLMVEVLPPAPFWKRRIFPGKARDPRRS